MSDVGVRSASRSAGVCVALLMLCAGALLPAADSEKLNPPLAPFRFSLPTETVSLSNSVAEPGHIPLALATNHPSLEIVEWRAESRPEEHEGEFIVRFVAPVPLGTVVAYEPGEVSIAVSNTWQALPPRLEAKRALQVLPAPPATRVEAIRFRIAARAIHPPGQPRSFQARLAFATFLPVRAINLAPLGRACASSSAPGAEPNFLNDGLVERGASFSTAGKPEADSGGSEWLAMTWDAPQSVRGMVLFRGAEDAALTDPRVEIFRGAGDPAVSATKRVDWQVVPVRSTAPGQFRANQFFVLMKAEETRALRLSSPGKIQLCEWAVIRLLGNAPAPEAPPAVVQRQWVVPNLKTGRIQVDGRDDDWPAGRTNGFALAWDEERLYLLYQARGADARFENSGTDALQLFHTGDALDLQFRAVVSNAPPAAAGERRLVVSLWHGNPVMALYESRSEDLLVVPRVFKSASKSVSFDKAALVSEAKVVLRRDGSQLTVEASVPLNVCGLEPRRMPQVLGDIGRLFGGEGRGYWASSATNRLADLADAAELHPQAWGVFRFVAAQPAP